MIRHGKYYYHHQQQIPLERSITHLLEECRMVLPGVQALFGFQLIVVFNNGFDQKLDHNAQMLHYCALILVSLSAALIMAPAAFHRIASPQAVSKPLLNLFTRLLMWGMVPLALGICLDLYLIGTLITSGIWALLLAVLVFMVLVALWFGAPEWMRVHYRREH